MAEGEIRLGVMTLPAISIFPGIFHLRTDLCQKLKSGYLETMQWGW